MSLSTKSIIALVLLFVGIIAVIVGIILFQININKQDEHRWYIWVIMLLGILAMVVAAIWLAFTLHPKDEVVIVARDANGD